MILACVSTDACTASRIVYGRPSWECLPSQALQRRTSHRLCVACKANPNVVVIGAGAAGLTAAYFAAHSGAEVCRRPTAWQQGTLRYAVDVTFGVSSGDSARKEPAVWKEDSDFGRDTLVLLLCCITAERQRIALHCITFMTFVVAYMLVCCSNVLPSRLDISQDYFTESSRPAIKAVFASWTLDKCKEWYNFSVNLPAVVMCNAMQQRMTPRKMSTDQSRHELCAASTVCCMHEVCCTINA